MILCYLYLYLSLQFGGQLFAMWSHFSIKSEKSCWFFILFSFFLVVRTGWQLLNSLYGYTGNWFLIEVGYHLFSLSTLPQNCQFRELPDKTLGFVSVFGNLVIYIYSMTKWESSTTGRKLTVWISAESLFGTFYFPHDHPDSWRLCCFSQTLSLEFLALSITLLSGIGCCTSTRITLSESQIVTTDLT